jgi:hypothetical protein
MKPLKFSAWRQIAWSVNILSMILERPRSPPDLIITGYEHSTFPASAHNFILAKGKRRSVPK